MCTVHDYKKDDVIIDSYFYPSVSLASVISDYVNLPSVISFLKLRASYTAVHGDVTSATVGTAPFSTITALGANPSGKFYV